MAFAIEENKCFSELGDYVVDYQRHGDGAQRVWKSGVVELWGFEEREVSFINNIYTGKIQPILYDKNESKLPYSVDYANITIDLPLVFVNVFNIYPQIQFTVCNKDLPVELSGTRQVGYYIKGRLVK